MGPVAPHWPNDIAWLRERDAALYILWVLYIHRQFIPDQGRNWPVVSARAEAGFSPMPWLGT